ncbi:MAG: GumC family protein [Fidelibacterota bacterium]
MEDKHLIEEEPKTLQEYLQLFLFHKGKIITITLLVLILSAVKLYFETPVYQANSVVMIDEDDQMENMLNFGNPMGDKTIANEIEIVKSRHLKRRLVEKVWNSPYRDNLYLLGTRKYHSNATELKKKLKSYLSFKKEEKENNGHGTSINFHAIVQKIQGGGLLSISNRRETNILDISFKSIDSLEAIYLVNQFVETYKNADIDWSSEEITNLNEFLVEQLEEAKAELTIAEDALQEYQERETVFGVEEEIKPLLEQVTNAETEYTNTVTTIKILQDKKRYLESQFSEKEKELAEKISSSIETKLEALRRELYLKEAELIRTRKSAGNIQHQAVNELKAEIAGIRKELEEETTKMISRGISVANPLEYSQALLEKVLAIDAELSGELAKKEELKKVTEQYNRKLSQLPEKQLKYIRLERDRKVLQQNYIFLRTKMEEAKIKKASNSGKIRIIDRAASAEKISPKKKQSLALGLVLGLGLSIGLVLLLDFLDNTIRTVDDIERTKIPLMGAVPQIGKYGVKKKKKKIKNDDKTIHDSLITHFDPKSPVAEAYRGIRTNINLTGVDKERKTILISSPGPGEGKTTTISNLAITFANLEYKTLLVDCDLRRPKIHTVFGIDKKPGLINIFKEEDDSILEMVRKLDDVNNLYVLPSGGTPPNPSELLGSKKMKQIIELFKKNFDVVLFDTPPFAAVTDPVMLAREVDMTLMVVKAGSTNKAAFYRSIQNLDQIGEKTDGVIMNWLNRNTSYDAYYYYQNYYHYYHEDKG